MVRNKILLGVTVALFMMPLNSGAVERERTGSYKGRYTEGKFWNKVKHEPGETTSRTGWKNERGEGQHEVQRKWDKENHKGTYTSTTTGAGGGTVTREGELRRSDDGKIIQEGTITGPGGRQVNVERNVVKNADGTTSVQSVFTGQGGKTLTAEKRIINENGTRHVAGQYKTSGGANGTFGSQSTVESGQINTQRSLTNQNGRSWKQNIKLRKEDNAVIRDVTNTNPNNESTSFTESIVVDENTTPPEATNQ